MSSMKIDTVVALHEEQQLTAYFRNRNLILAQEVERLGALCDQQAEKIKTLEEKEASESASEEAD